MNTFSHLEFAPLSPECVLEIIHSERSTLNTPASSFKAQQPAEGSHGPSHMFFAPMVSTESRNLLFH